MTDIREALATAGRAYDHFEPDASDLDAVCAGLIEFLANEIVAGGILLADGDYGDVVVSGAGTVFTVDTNAVTNAKLADMPASTIKGNNTGGAADPADLTVAQTKTLLALAVGDVTGAAASATSLTAGTGLTGGGDLSANRTFNVAANADGSITVNADDIQVGILASDAQHGVRGGGTQHANAVAAGAAGFMTGADKTKLDGIAAGATNNTLAVTASAPVNVTKSAAAVGVATDAARSDHKHDVTTAAASSVGSANAEGSASSLSRSDHTHDLIAGSVALNDMANVATARILGRVTAGTGVPEAMTGTQTTTLLDAFTSALKGLAPASGGGTANFLRADGTWAAPSGGPGGGATVGTAEVDFGAFPGASDASVAVTGQASIVAGSVVSAWLRPVASTDHTADEHLVETLRVVAGNISAGTGFTIYALNTSQQNEPLETVGLGRRTDGAAANPSPGIAPSVGGVGTRIYGKWTIAWSWQ